MDENINLNTNQLSPDRKKQKSILNFPMKLVQIYLSFVIILYVIGPLNWQTRDPFLFYSFLFLAQIILLAGFKSSMKGQFTSIHTKSTAYDKTYLKYLKFAIIFNLAFVILSTIRNTGMSSFSIDSLIVKLIMGLTNPGQQYYEKFDTAVFGGSLLTYTTVILSPFLWMVIPLSLYYFGRLNFLNKILTIVSIFFEAIRWIATGTNKGLIDLILIISSIIIIKNLQGKYSNWDTTKLKTKNKFKIYIPIIILMIAGMIFFSNAISSRVGGIYDQDFSIHAHFNKNSLLLRFLPEFLKPTIVYMTSYLTQGYYALSLAFTESFTPMFGIGNSMFLMDNFKKIFDVNFYQYTYQTRLAHLGWDPLGNWHSIYIWMANDISFFGILPLLYLLGRFFGKISKDVIINKNPIACAIFCLLIIMFFYFPLNNQVLSYPTTFMAFWGLTCFWLLKRYKSRHQIENS